MEALDYKAVVALQELYQREPWKFFKDALGVEDKSLWAAPLEIMNALISHKRVAVKAGVGVSKSYTISRLILWWLCSYYPSKVVSTAPTYSQVARILWSELASAYKKAIRPIGGALHNTELIFAPDWFGTGLATDEEARMQGFHSENLLVVFDEAGGVKPEIWNAARGLVTGENSRWLAVGNPVQASGDFFDCFKAESGWYPITISCLDTPNYKEKKEVIKGVTTYDWVEQCRKEFGEDSALWYSKVLGQFPVEAGNTLIPLAWVENCRRESIDLDKLLGVHREKRYVGVDVARMGVCSTIITVTDGWNVLYQREYNKRNNVDVAGIIIDTLRDEGLPDSPIAIDDTGLGGGVSDILKEQGYNVVSVILKAESDDKEKFYDIRTEMFWELRTKFQKGMISIKDPETNKRLYDKLTGELTSLTYDMDKRGRIKVTPKERIIKEMVKNGKEGKSPDRADSLALAVYAAREMKRGRSRIPDRGMKTFAGAAGY